MECRCWSQGVAYICWCDPVQASVLVFFWRLTLKHPRLQVTVCKEQAEWARAEKRTFLRQRIELRLAALYLQMQDYPTALSLLGT